MRYLELALMLIVPWLLDLERLCQSEGNSVRYDALKRLIQQSGMPGSYSFQATSNPPYRSSPMSQQNSSQARSVLGDSMSPRTNSSGSVFCMAREFAKADYYVQVWPISKRAHFSLSWLLSPSQQNAKVSRSRGTAMSLASNFD